MKKLLISVIVVGSAAILAVIAFLIVHFLPKETQYVVKSDFFYSKDAGHTYGNGTKEYEIGGTVYMKVKIIVSTNKADVESVGVKLTIPKITAVDARYVKGNQRITSTTDALLDVTTWEFSVSASKNPQEWEIVFQFIPNAESDVKIELTFDDKIDEMYDRMDTVFFVAAEEEPDETPSGTPAETPDEPTDNT